MFCKELFYRPPEDWLGHLRDSAWCAFLDSGGAGRDPRARWSYLCWRPVETLIVRRGNVLRNGQSVQGDWQSHLRDMNRRSKPASRCDAPFQGGVIGLARYNAGLRAERVTSRHVDPGPDLIAATFTDLLAFDREAGRCWWLSENGSPVPEAKPAPRQFSPLTFVPDMSRADWIAACEAVRAFIGAGDIFQANLTMRWQALVEENFDPVAAYCRIRETSPAPFGAFLHTPETTLLSASVERFLALEPGGRVETCPIKGTAPLHAGAALAVDIKERAENLMITDLMRNDIGRVCVLGSVAVPRLAQVEAFTHVLHLVSQVTGVLKDGCDAIDLLDATLPPGSVTGAPKHRALDIIDSLEKTARGAYCGTVFRIGRDGAMDSSVVIRSAERVGERLSIGAGGGITWDSDPAREYDESCLKAQALLAAIGA